MTRERAKQLLPIITAFANGEDVQFLTEIGYWTNFGASVRLSFDEDPSRYRITPKPRKVWVNEYSSPSGGTFYGYATKQEADASSSQDRIACHEIELPFLP
jgi:hypothetical protein